MPSETKDGKPSETGRSHFRFNGIEYQGGILDAKNENSVNNLTVEKLITDTSVGFGLNGRSITFGDQLLTDAQLRFITIDPRFMTRVVLPSKK